MGWRTIIITKICKLDLKANYMSIRDVEKSNRILINEIDTLILETTAVSITAALLIELSKNGVNIILCDQKHNPHSLLSPLYGSHNSSDRIRKQIRWTKEFKDIVWREIIRIKIANQNKVLKFFSQVDYELEGYMQEVEVGDITNREGHAAKIYFNRLFGNDFSRKKETIENAGLDYGYAIILSMINREVVQFGCLTQIGIHHDNQFNQYNLGCDLMEPLRPLVDYYVIKNKWIDFNIESKREMQEILNHKVQFSGQTYYLTNAVRLYCKSVLNCLIKKDIKKIEFIEYEL